MLLAGPQLLSLSCRPRSNEAPDIAAIARLSSLTRLELICYSSKADFSALWGLGLRELLLIHCPHIPSALIVPNALPDLQTLRILEDTAGLKEAAYEYDLEHPESGGHLEAQQLVSLGAVVLSHPCIRQVSGRCRLLNLGMAEGLKGWKKSWNNEPPLPGLDWWSGEPVWTRPHLA